ncbi:tfp pilus assembly protein PilV [Gynuella sunshinyii YC6258]|uniref:Tfp pilus assembly protein PilV n=2 Tax=Gynuella sunshinyii TaxID=1445505 RepID=A0A0C5VDX0_9GAMM|nr:tfp pilus assembly protein PilV [Gynuella sunshinyii YC6258]
MHTQTGTSMIEVLVTVVILSVSLLAMAAMQTQSVKLNQSALLRSQANIMAYEIMDRIRINRGKDSTNIAGYTADYDATPSGNTLAVQDVSSWRSNLASTLPAGKGAIDCVAATRLCKVSVKWSEEQIFGAAATNNPDATTEFVYQTNI